MTNFFEFAKLDALKETCPAGEWYWFAKDLNVGKSYFAVRMTAIDEFACLFEQNNNLYEILPPNKPVRPYFDLEIDDVDDHNGRLYFFLEWMDGVFWKEFGIRPKPLVIDSCRENKLSYHVILTNCHVENVAALKDFIHWMFDLMQKDPVPELQWTYKNEQRLIFDKVPYGSNQCFRMVNQSKKGKEYILRCDTKPLDAMVRGSTGTLLNLQKYSKTQKPVDACELREDNVSDTRSLHEETQKSEDALREEFLGYYNGHLLDKVATKGTWEDWRNMSFALYNTFQKEGKDLFVMFSKINAEKYDEKTTMYHYDHLTLGGEQRITFKTIRAWARANDVQPVQQGPLLCVPAQTSLWSAPLFTTGLIADHFKELHGDKFICVDDCVYHFTGIVWEKDDKKNSYLTNFFDKVFHKELMQYAASELTHYTALLPDEMVESKIGRIRAFFKFIYELRNSGARKGMLDDVVAFITTKVKFDNNPYLFAFNNKVYDLKLGQFVEPRPDFYITKTAKYDYTSGTDRTELTALLRTILPPDVLEDWLTTNATGLCGFQLENLFIETGCGRNGKGLLSSLMLATVGDYGYTLPSSTLLSEIKTGPNPEIANLHNKRYVVTCEPPQDRKINCATLKSLTGDKTINARGLYSSNCETNLALTLTIQANGLPLLDEVSVAVIQRVRITPFNNTFVNQEEYDRLDESDRVNVGVTNPFYKTDEFHNANRCAFFDILCEHFKGFVANGCRLRAQPKACIEKCKDYFAVSDNIFSWMTEFYEQAEGHFVALSDIYETFRGGEVYLNFSKLDKRKYSRKYFCEQIEKNMFLKRSVKLRKTYYCGIQLSADSLVGWRMIQMDDVGGQDPEAEYK